MLRIVFRENGKQTSDCSDVITVCLTLFFSLMRFLFCSSFLSFSFFVPLFACLFSHFWDYRRLYNGLTAFRGILDREEEGKGSVHSVFCGFNIFSEAKYAWLRCHNTLSTMCLNSRNVRCSLWHLLTLELQISSYKSVTISSDVAQSDDRAINITSLRLQPRDHTGCHYMYTNGISNRAMKLNAEEEGERV